MGFKTAPLRIDSARSSAVGANLLHPVLFTLISFSGRVLTVPLKVRSIMSVSFALRLKSEIEAFSSMCLMFADLGIAITWDLDVIHFAYIHIVWEFDR